MTGYLGIFLLAWFLGWAFFAVLVAYLLTRLVIKYEILARIEKYLEHLANFEKEFETA